MNLVTAFPRWPAAVVVTTALLGGASLGDATAQTKEPRPDPDEVQSIAEEGYIYGLPLVMNYAAMYEMAVNRDSTQFKAPFNQIANEARVFTYEDTAVIVPNSDTPYSTLFMDLRAEPLVLSVPAVEKGRYYSVQLVDGSTFNYGYVGSRATGNDPGDYLVAGPGLEGREAGGSSPGVPVVDAVLTGHLPGPAPAPGTTVKHRNSADFAREEGSQSVQRAAAVTASSKAVKAGLLATVMLTAAMTPVFAEGTSAAAPDVALDGAGAKSGRVDNTHETRFIEIFLAHPDAKTGKLVAECYNTIFTSDGIPASRDTAPQARVEGLNFAQMKTDYGVEGASLNGPKVWLPDWTEIDIGVEREFNSIKAAWVAQLDMGSNAGGVADSTPYKPMSIARKSGLGWHKGNTVLLLDDAEGNTWVMKGFQLGLKPTKTYEQFAAAGAANFKKLPPGWKFRTRTLDRDLNEKPEGGVATIMADEFFNVYDKTGPGMSNYKP